MRMIEVVLYNSHIPDVSRELAIAAWLQGDIGNHNRVFAEEAFSEGVLAEFVGQYIALRWIEYCNAN